MSIPSRSFALLLVALGLGGLGCADAPPEPQCPALYGFVAKAALVTTAGFRVLEAGPVYSMARTLVQGGESGLRLSASAARPRTIRWAIQENVLIAYDTAVRDPSGRNGEIADGYLIREHLDLCGRIAFAPWYDREMMRVEWSPLIGDLLEDAHGAAVEAQALPLVPAPGTPFATELYCDERSCDDPIRVGARITRVVTFGTLAASDAAGVRRMVVVRTEFRRAGS